MALAEGLGVIPYSPLGGGLLTGKYSRAEKPVSGRFIENKIYQTRYDFDWIRETVGRFAAFAAERGIDPVSLAVAWVGSHPAVTAPIIGGRGVEQLRSSVASLDIDMTPKLRDEVSALSPEPPPATDRTEERTPFNYGVR
jgi:aryl-alcohol dehydrogenase-like predicted oxidoreductase